MAANKFLFVSYDGLIADIAWQVVKEGCGSGPTMKQATTYRLFRSLSRKPVSSSSPSGATRNSP